MPDSDGIALADREARKYCTWDVMSHYSGLHIEYRKRPCQRYDDAETHDNITGQFSEYSDFERYAGVKFLFGETNV